MIKFLKIIIYSIILVNFCIVFASQNEREEEARQFSPKPYNNPNNLKDLPNNRYPYASGGYHYEGKDPHKGAAIFTKKSTNTFWQRLKVILSGHE